MRASVAGHGLTIFVAFVFASMIVSVPLALADGGQGGGESFSNNPGPPGGTGFTGNPGGDGSCPAGCTGGGGGGAGGGAGGGGGFVFGADGGGLGGTAASPNGQNGGGTLNHGGGGGGFNGNGATNQTVLPSSFTFIGGNDGNGAGTAAATFSGGGGGGAGGFGAVLTGTGPYTINAGSSATGGNGGNGGNGTGPGGSGGDGGVGVQFTQTGVTLTNAGTITGGNGGIGGLANVGAQGGANGSNGVGGAGVVGTVLSVINSGTIAGGNGSIGISGSTLTVVNSGTITGQQGGIFSTSGATQVTNTGLITATVNNAAIFSSGALTLNNSNSIIGHDTAVSTNSSANVTNSGTISAFRALFAGAGASSVFNSGTMTGTGGTAISFNGAANTLTLAPTGVINGVVQGTGTDIFQLGGSGSGSFNLASIGAVQQFQGFSTFNVVGGGWTVSGTFGQAQAWNVLGGTLAGTGTLKSVNVAGGGTLAPGLPGVPGGTMTVNGNLAFQSGAVYLVQLNPATASLASVTGTASLGGNVLAAFAPGTYTTRQYTILTSAGLGGTTFAGVGTTNLTNFIATLSYTNTSVLLNLTAALGAGTAGLGGNQQRVATAINNFFNSGGALSPNFLTLFGLSGGNLSTALTQLSGEVGTGAQQATFNAMTQFLGIMSDPTISGRGNTVSAGGSPSAYADEEALAYTANGKPRSKSERDAYAAMARKAPPLAADTMQRWSVWGAGFGGTQTTDGDPVVGSNRAKSRVFGGAVGADYRFSPDTLAGFALAGGGTDFRVDNSGTGRSDLFQAGAFVRQNFGPAYISAALAYGWQDVTTDRTATIAGTDLLRGRFNANALSGRAEGGYRFVVPVLGGFGLTPYAAGQFTTFWLPGYAEAAIAGSNAFALTYGAKTVTDSRSELGFRTDKSYALAGAILTLRGREAWVHDYNPNRSIGATFLTLPGASFVVNGAAQPRDAWLSSTSAELNFMNGWSLAAVVDSEWARRAKSYAGRGVVRYQW